MAKTRNSDSMAFLFDLDGTLIDSVYQHVLAWREATQAAGIELPVWRIHRQIGMSGGLMLNALAGKRDGRSRGRMRNAFNGCTRRRLRSRLRLCACFPARKNCWIRWRPIACPMPSRRADVCTTHGMRSSCSRSIERVPVITRDDVRFAKPDPDLFVAAGKRLKVPMSRCVIVGDSVWDLLAARRAFALSVGLLSGGYGREELERAGAYRVYQDPADLLRHLDEVGVRLSHP